MILGRRWIRGGVLFSVPKRTSITVSDQRLCYFPTPAARVSVADYAFSLLRNTPLSLS